MDSGSGSTIAFAMLRRWHLRTQARRAWTRRADIPATGPTAQSSADGLPRTRSSINVSGALNHQMGAQSRRFGHSNGVRGWIISSKRGALATWTVKGFEAETTIRNLDVSAGELLDFAVDSLGDYEADGFTWSPQIEEVLTEEQAPVRRRAPSLERGTGLPSTRGGAAVPGGAIRPDPADDQRVRVPGLIPVEARICREASATEKVRQPDRPRADRGPAGCSWILAGVAKPRGAVGAGQRTDLPAASAEANRDSVAGRTRAPARIWAVSVRCIAGH